MRDWIFIRPTMRHIADTVARDHGLIVEDLRVQSHRRAVSWPRQEAMEAMHRAGFSHGQIVRFFGLKNWSTSRHACEVVKSRALAKQEAA